MGLLKKQTTQKTPNQETTKIKPTIMQIVQKRGTIVDKSET